MRKASQLVVLVPQTTRQILHTVHTLKKWGITHILIFIPGVKMLANLAFPSYHRNCHFIIPCLQTVNSIHFSAFSPLFHHTTESLIIDTLGTQERTKTHVIWHVCTSVVYAVLCQSFQSQFGGGGRL